MVVINKYSSLQISSLSQVAARVVYDSTLNVLRFNNSSTYSNILVDKDLSNNLSNINNVITTGNLGVNTTAPSKQVEINSSTGDCLRLTNNDSNGGALNYSDLLVSSSGDLSITPSGGNVNITTHNGVDKGLKLNNVLVTSTAQELNYVDITTKGVAEMNKALVVDENRNIINLNYIESNEVSIIHTSPVDNEPSIGLSLISVPTTAPASGSGVGIEFDIVNDASGVFPACKINCISSDIVSDTENAFLEFNLINDGTMNTVATISPTGVLTATTLAETSDIRLKENIIDVEPSDSLSQILSVNIKEYNYIFDSKKIRHTGVIAQEIKQVMPCVVSIEKSHGLEDFHSVQYTGLVPHLVNCIKELKIEIEEIKKYLQ
jgi:hypothetical protein